MNNSDYTFIFILNVKKIRYQVSLTCLTEVRMIRNITKYLEREDSIQQITNKQKHTGVQTNSN